MAGKKLLGQVLLEALGMGDLHVRSLKLEFDASNAFHGTVTAVVLPTINGDFRIEDGNLVEEIRRFRVVPATDPAPLAPPDAAPLSADRT